MHSGNRRFRSSVPFCAHGPDGTCSECVIERSRGHCAKDPVMSRQALEAEAALILEQEGWVLVRLSRESPSGRLRQFAERYQAWQDKVKEFRAAHPEQWPEPPDNS